MIHIMIVIMIIIIIVVIRFIMIINVFATYEVIITLDIHRNENIRRELGGRGYFEICGEDSCAGMTT